MQKPSIAERRYIKATLQDEGAALIQSHQKAIRSRLTQRTGNTARSISMQVSAQGFGAKLDVTHLARQRFLDMKTRNGQRKKQYKIHNRILFGHQSTIIRKLKFGFTKDVQNQFKTANQSWQQSAQ